MKVIKQSFSVKYEYPVLFTRGVLHPDNNILEQAIEFGPQVKLLMVLDSGVHHHHPKLVQQWGDFANRLQQQCQVIADPLIIEGGEESKNNPSFANSIVEAIHQYKIDRHSYIVAVGGGAVLDVAGYAAAIAHRGVRLIRIPTTVLAQNDSGVGVKNGINEYGKKNFLGTFAPPFAVINDSDFLSTLDIRDWRSGIAEAIKVALIKSADFFQSIEDNVDSLNTRQQESMEQLIYHCALMHVEHIAAGDPFEQGSSRPLDFGHWSAHKMEQLSHYQLRHGEAVAMGIALDCVYAHVQGFLNAPQLQRILQLLRALNFSLFDPVMLHDELLEGLNEFREHLGGKLTVLLLKDIGSSFEVHDMDQNAIRRSIDYLHHYAAEPQS